MYCIEVSKEVGPYLLFVPAYALGGMVHIRYRSLPWSSGVQDNLEGIHAIIRPMCENLQKMSRGSLSLRLA